MKGFPPPKLLNRGNIHSDIKQCGFYITTHLKVYKNGITYIKNYVSSKGQ